MVNTLLKRIIIDGQHTVRSILFNYRNKNFLENVWEIINETLEEEYQPISDIKITATNVCVFKGKHILNNSHIICKIPLDNQALERARRSFSNIRSIINESRISNLIPLPINIIECQYGKIFIETLFVGTDGHESVRHRLTGEKQAISDGINVIKNIQEQFPQYSVVFGEKLGGQLQQDIKHNFSSNGIEGFQHEELHRVLEKVRNSQLILGFSHGDYWLGNLIFNQDKLLGIIDWDRFTLDQPIIYDRMHLEIFYYAMKNGWSLGEEIISRYKHYPSEDLIIYWCFFIKNSINSNPLITKNKRWMEKNYYKVIQNLA